jgi:hypothetical protein
LGIVRKILRNKKLKHIILTKWHRHCLSTHVWSISVAISSVQSLFTNHMRIPTNLISGFARGLSIVALGTFVACSHPGPEVANISGGATGSTEEPPITFALADLEGDWFGQLVPDSVAREKRNFYFSVVGGQLIESADSFGNQWTSIDTSSLDITTEGLVSASLSSVLVTNNIVLSAQMNDAMTLLTGTFSHLDPSDTVVDGTFVLKRSMGSGQFAAPVLEGSWSGMGTNSVGKRRLIDLLLDTAGAVLSGELIRPFDNFVQHVYSPGPGNIFTFTNDSVGRMDNVQILADDGSTLFFTYALIDEDGTLIGGPGFDSLMGSGVATLTKSVAGGGAE